MDAPKLKELEPAAEELSWLQACATDEGGRVYITRIAYPPGQFTGDLRDHFVNLYETENSLMLLRGQAVDYASDVDDLLHELLMLYLERNAQHLKLLRKLLRKKNITDDKDAGVETLERLDFMGHKDLLSSILEKDKSLGGKKGYTTLLNSIILERNKYAHGKFYFHARDKTTIIQWKKNEHGVRERKHAEITPDTLLEFADCCLRTCEWLSSLKKHVEEQ